MIVEAIYLVALCAIGLGLIGRHVRTLGPLLAAAICLPLGLSVMALAQLLLAVVGLGLSAATVWILVFALAAAACGYGFSDRGNRQAPAWIAAALAGGAVVVVALAQSSLKAATLSYDSYDYLVIASSVYRPDGTFRSPEMTGMLYNYAPLLWLSHAPARLLGLEFLQLLHPAIFLSTLGAAAALTEAVTRGRGLTLDVRILSALAPALVLATTPQVLHHAVYVMPNLLTGLLLIAAVGCFWTADQRRAPQLALIGAVCLAAVTLARQEGGLMAAVVVALFATAENIGWRRKTAAAAIVAAVASGWYAVLFLLSGPAGEDAILTPTAIALQIGGLWAGAVACLLWAAPALRPLVRLGAMSMPLVLVLGHVALFVSDPAHALQSMGVFIANLFYQGSLWGPWWGAALAIGALALATPDRVPFGRIMGVAALTLVLLVDLLGIVRELPYRLGDQDSGNRMLLHVAPLLWAYLSARFALATAAPERAGQPLDEPA